MTKPICGAVLKSDVGSDYTCTEPASHTNDPRSLHCDSRHPFSWRQTASHMTQGRIIPKLFPAKEGLLR